MGRDELYTGDLSTPQQPLQSLVRDERVFEWLRRLVGADADRVVDLTAYDDEFKKRRYNCMDAALGLVKKERRVGQGDGGQPGQFSDQSIAGRGPWNCEVLRQMVKDDADAMQRDMVFRSKPQACTGDLVYLMTTDTSGTNRGDFHFLLFAHHVVFRLNDRIIGTVGGTRSSSILSKMRCGPDARVFVFDEPTAFDGDIAPGKIVFVKNAKIYVHKRGTATPFLFTDKHGSAIKQVDGAPDGDFVYDHLAYTKKCGHACISSRKVMTARDAFPTR